ncbi:MAG: glycosyltransferase family 4 protein [Nitrososphaerota archaeon]|nr:glycosyltransferase family 4 protein [Nitrososphaerota archaeon]
MDKLRILLVLPASKGETGFTVGFEKMADCVAGDVALQVLYTRASETLSRSRFLARLPKFFGNSILLTITLLRREYDFVWTPSVLSVAFYLLILKRFARFRFRLILHLAGLPSERPGFARRLIEAGLQGVSRKSDIVWYIDDFRLASFASQNKRCSLVPTPVDVETFRPDSSRRRATRTRLQLGEAFGVGIIGPFDPFYNGPGLSYVLQHLGSLPDSAKLLVVGEYGKIKPESSDKVLFAGKVPFDEYLDLMRAMDCLIVPRTVKTHGPQSKVLEAMAVGLPVVQTSMATPPRGYTNGKDLFVVVSIDEIFRVLASLVDDLGLRASVSEAARSLVANHYSNAQVRSMILTSLRATEVSPRRRSLMVGD